MWTCTPVLSSRPKQQQQRHRQRQQQKSSLERLRFNRRGASTPLRIIMLSPYVVRTPHLYGAPTTEETSFVKPQQTHHTHHTHTTPHTAHHTSHTAHHTPHTTHQTPNKTQDTRHSTQHKQSSTINRQQSTIKKKINHNHHNNINTNNKSISGRTVFFRDDVFAPRGASTPLQKLNHALSHEGGPTQSQLSRPMSSGHHISMEHRLRRKHLQLAMKH